MKLACQSVLKWLDIKKIRWPVRTANSKLTYKQWVTMKTASYFDKHEVILTNYK